MTGRWRQEFTAQSAGKLSRVRFPRSGGWLRLRTGERAVLWINPDARAIAWLSAVRLSTFNHPDDHGFCAHFADIAFGCVQRNQTFPAAIRAETEPEMLERLRQLGMTAILKPAGVLKAGGQAGEP